MSTCTKFLLLFITFLFITKYGYGKRVYNPNRKWFRKNGNPGARIRLTKRGLDHIRSVVIGVINKEIPKLPKVSAGAKFGALGEIQIEDAKITHYKPPTFTIIKLKPPDSIIIGIENMDIAARGKFLVKYQDTLEIPGKIRGSNEGITVAAIASINIIGKDLSAKVTSCKAVMRKADYSIQVVGPFASFIKKYRSVINGAVRAYMPAILCRLVANLVAGQGKGLLNMLTGVEFPLDNPITQQYLPSSGTGAGDALTRRVLSGLTMGNAILGDPLVTPDYIEMELLGSVFYKDRPLPTPFSPPPLKNFNESKKMIYMQSSDYGMNSLLYHAYHADKLAMIINKEQMTEAFQNFLNTTCIEKKKESSEEEVEATTEEYNYDEEEDYEYEEDTGDGGGEEDIFKRVCVGSLLPSVNRKYPNAEIEMVMFPHGIPSFEFADGKGVLFVSGRVILYVLLGKKGRGRKRRKKQILVTNFDGQADVRTQVVSNKIVGNIKINTLNFRLHRSSLSDIEPKNVKQLGTVAKQLLGPELSRGLKRGFPLPGAEYVNFVRPLVTIKEGYNLVESDFQVNRAKIQQMASDGIKEGLKAFGNAGLIGRK